MQLEVSKPNLAEEAARRWGVDTLRRLALPRRREEGASSPDLDSAPRRGRHQIAPRRLARPRPRRQIRPRRGGHRRRGRSPGGGGRHLPASLLLKQPLQSTPPACSVRRRKEEGRGRQEGFVVPLCATRAFISLLPAAAREATGSSGGIQRAAATQVREDRGIGC